MGMTNCSGPCELCINNGHCLAGCGDDEFQLDEDELRRRHETEFENCKPSDVCCSSCIYGTMTRVDGPCGGVYKQASIEMLKFRLQTLDLTEEQIAHIQHLIEQIPV